MNDLAFIIEDIVYKKGSIIYNDWKKQPKFEFQNIDQLNEAIIAKKNLEISLRIERLNARIKNKMPFFETWLREQDLNL